MSRAFTKEDDAGEDLPERPVPPGPNYVTPRGLQTMQEAGRDLVERRKRAAVAGGDLRPFERDLRYLEARINSAIVVPVGSGLDVRFGAHVTLETKPGQRTRFQIVGEDEAKTGGELLSWASPLSMAMLGLKVGDTFLLEDTTASPYRIISVEYSPT